MSPAVWCVVINQKVVGMPFLFALESDQLDGVEVEGEQRIIDGRGQIALIPPLPSEAACPGQLTSAC